MTNEDLTLKSVVRSSDVAVLVVSCDVYRFLWEPFFKCFFKYWPDCPYQVYLGSNFASYPDPRVQAILVGPDIDYSTNLIAMLSYVEHRRVILWIEDRILAAPVDTSRLVNLVKLAQDQQIAYLKLIASHPFAIIDDEMKEIGDIPKGTKYRVCMTVALWDKQALLKLLRPGETAWEIERRGSQRSNELNESFFSLSFGLKDKPLLHDMHLIIKGRVLRDSVNFLKREGLEDYLSKRPLQTLISYWYVKTYIAIKDLYNQLRWRWHHSRWRKAFSRGINYC